ncbi:glyoxylate reductase hydroxypyruvate reductase-like [Brachionus plicatilis]|uniref:Glyoxylate reductase/hydroxypyruvate reductase n=1 Tax=Brachionus plicatilis TaxID=10195 RepID=A0A3M7S8J9_BRAPC|nr:glyoxylate reductase hydroxypyruvate reductase-like [Brachionus plicatilis]
MSSSSSKYKVFVTQSIPKEAESILTSNNVELVVNQKTPLERGILLENVKNKDGLFCTLNEKIDQQVLQTAGLNLKVVGTCSVGYDHISLEECRERNIQVGYTPGVLTDATAELAVGLLLDTSRRISEAISSAKSGEWGDWKIMWMCGRGLSGSNVGIFGLGRIGLAVANRLKNFGVNKIIYHNRKPNEEALKYGYEYADLDTLLQESDFLVVTCSATKETEKFFNMEKFKKMKPSAIFVNVSRGSVVNQEDLCSALKNGIIGAAGLDVTTPEPLPLDHELFKLNNCFITPHICSAEVNTRVKMAVITATNIVNALQNKPLLHQIN